MNKKPSKKEDSQNFYWIRLMTSFFNRDVIDFLMAQKDGANYVVLYLMLLLQSANTDGRLEVEMGDIIIPIDVKKIERDTKFFNIDTILVGIELFKKLGLVYEDVNKTLVLPELPYLVGTSTGQTIRKNISKIEKNILGGNTGGKSGGKSGGKNYQQSIEYRDKSIEYKDIEYRDIYIKNHILGQNEPKKTTVDELFNIFWNAYPKKVGKANALKWFRDYKGSAKEKLHGEKLDINLVNKMVETINLFKTSKKWTDNGGQYIPHPTTWLNSGGWNDKLLPDEISKEAKEKRDQEASKKQMEAIGITVL